jgi:predicted RNA-binding Zn ribbon-like protein
MEISRKVELRIVGGHVALNLVNTVAPRIPGGDGSGRTEYLPTHADLLAWAQRVGLVDASEAADIDWAWSAHAAAPAQALHAVRDVREALYAALVPVIDPGHAAESGASAGLASLTLRWAAATGRSELVPAEPGTGAARLVIGTVPAQMIPDRLAVAAVDFVRTVDVVHLRSCPITEGGCGWLFVDTSRNGSRRWCAMEDCGARAKARRLNSRRREGGNRRNLDSR